MSPEDSGRRRQIKVDRQDVFFGSSAEISKARHWCGRSQLLLQILQHVVLVGSQVSKGREWGKKKAGGGASTIFLMRNTKKERTEVFLSTYLGVPQLPNHKGKGRRRRDDSESTRNSTRLVLEQCRRSLGLWGDATSRRIWARTQKCLLAGPALPARSG